MLTQVVDEKMVTDIFTWLKVLLVAFMTIGGFILFDKSNFTPFIPPEFGASGVMRGAISSFFGYLGFDAGRSQYMLSNIMQIASSFIANDGVPTCLLVCCVAGEAINAERNLPLSIMITLVLVTSLYIAAAISLVGMQNYQYISPESGFPGTFLTVYSHSGAYHPYLTTFSVVLRGFQIQWRRVGISADGIW